MDKNTHMQIKFIATFSHKHYGLYGKKFLTTIVQTLDCLNEQSKNSYFLVVAIDGLDQIVELNNFSHPYVELVNYSEETYKRHNFIKGVTVPDESSLDIAGQISRQIIRWSYKGMMQIEHLKMAEQKFDFVVYIDSDTIFKNEIIEKDLLELLPENKHLLSAVFRNDIGKYTETGWIAWNVKHKDYNKWVDLYSKCWNDHIYETLEEYHDCAIFDWTCKHFYTGKFKNLSGGGEHGFNTGPLGNFIDHKKGIRKHLGFSYENITFLNNKVGHFIYKGCLRLYMKLTK